jgi:hypothetical protein
MISHSYPRIKDNGTREVFSTGAHREAKVGRGRFDLLPGDALDVIAKHFEAGAKGKGDRNWEKGIPFSSYLNSTLRHLLNGYMVGDDTEDHLAAAAWNLLCMIATRQRIKKGALPESLDDLGQHLKTLKGEPDYVI